MPRAKKYHIPGYARHITHRSYRGEFCWTYNANNELENDGDVTSAYDNGGNTPEKTVPDQDYDPEPGLHYNYHRYNEMQKIKSIIKTTAFIGLILLGFSVNSGSEALSINHQDNISRY